MIADFEALLIERNVACLGKKRNRVSTGMQEIMAEFQAPLIERNVACLEKLGYFSENALLYMYVVSIYGLSKTCENYKDMHECEWM